MLQAAEVQLPDIVDLCRSWVVLCRTDRVCFVLIGCDGDDVSQVHLNIIDCARALRVIYFDVEFDYLISEV